MNKKFLSAVLFGALMVSSTGTFVSCKDYDDDIDDLREQLNKKASLDELNQKVTSMESSVAEAKKAAEDAKTKAEEALKKAEEGGSTSGVTEADLANLKKEIEDQIGKLASLESVTQKVAELKKELEAGFMTEEDLKELNGKVDKLSAEIMQIIGHRLTSISLIPTEHINGIAAITLTTLQYTPQAYKAMTQHEADPEKHANRPVLDHVDAGKVRYISTEKNEAYFHVSPNLGVRTEDIELPAFDCISSTNTTRSASVTTNSPIIPTSKVIKDGVLTVTYKKSDDFLGKQIATTTNGNTESFYMASLKIPVTEANYTETEKADKKAGKIDGVYVNSEYSRIEEIVAIPYLANSKTDFSKLLADKFADEVQKDADKKDVYVHYHDSVCLYNSVNNQLVDVEQAYNQPLDLNTLVTVCTTTEGNHVAHKELKNYADYGLEFRFALANAKYLQGDRKTDEQAFAKILNGNKLKSEVYDVNLGDNEYSRASIGREPIVRVSLVDTKNGNALIAQRYIKVRWIDKGENQTLNTFNFVNDTISCHDMYQQLFSKDMNEAIYHQVKFNGGQSMSKTEFHNVFKSLKIKSLKKDGVAIDLTKLKVSTDATADWNESTPQVKDGKEALENNVDLLFGFLHDAADNTSYNLVWAMNEQTVGTLKDKGNGNYGSKFEIEIEYEDAIGTVGNIVQNFTQEIIVPKQEFAYQATYWKNGVGEGTFNVNPIVFKTADDSWADGSALTPDHNHQYDGTACQLKDYSHISADLVNGYIYKAENAKPANLAQFIKYIRDCADVRFVFDQSRFNKYDYLAGYTVSKDGISLWKGTAPASWNQFDYIQTDKALAATIENKMGATAQTNKDAKFLPWNFDETLGSTTDECTSTVRLHEIDKLNGTEAAQALVGKSVPVNLVVEYNSYNVIPVQQFEIFFINPLTIDGAIKGNFVDAEIDGSFLNVGDGFNFTDWNGNKVAAKDIAKEKNGEYAHELYDYYGVHNVKFLTNKVTTSLSFDAATNSYKHTEGVKDGKLPTNASLQQMEATETNGVVDKANAKEVTEDPTHLAYFNNNGTPVNVDYKMYISVEVAHKWGVLKKEALEVNVAKAGGTPSGN